MALRLLLLISLLAACVSAQPLEADLVLRNGKIVTVDDRFGTVSAMAIRGDRILAVGRAVDVQRYMGDGTEVVNLEGKLVVPGFIEGHAHFSGIGDSMQILDLRTVRNWDDVVAMVAKAVERAKPGEWIRGRGWHQEKWDRTPENDVEGFPSHHAVSAVSPNNPVAFTHASGHAAFFNQKAMSIAGVTAKTKNPAGGEILHTPDGEPCGVFRETASRLIFGAMDATQARRTPAQAREELERSLRLADQECLRKGVTSFQDAGTPLSGIDVMRRMAEQGQLKTRLWVMIRDSNARLARQLPSYWMVGLGDNRLTVRAIKRTLDGALGARGAWLLEPYSDSPESTGLATASVESVETTARLAKQNGWQMCVHAIGDRANREVLDMFERAFGGDTDQLRDARWRVEHAQHIHPDDIPRFGKLGVVASMQAVHCTSDAPFVTPRLGEQRAEGGAYMWRTLIDTGAIVTNGTDAPVEDVDPIASFYASVTRRMKDGNAFYPDQCMTRMEALESYTIECARAAFEEDLKGSLSPGKLADCVVLSKDIMSCDEEEILETRVLRTIVGGETVYQADE